MPDQEYLQTRHESYRTESYGPWHTRECDPLEYDVKALECVKLANKTDSESHPWFLPQAKILQDRAIHIRLEWATRKALEVNQSDPPAVQPITQQSSHSLAKKKRNQKTRLQYKRRSLLHVTTVQIQEVEHSLGAWK